MRFPPLRPMTTCLIQNSARRLLIAGYVVLLQTSLIHAQADSLFPEPSSVLTPPRSRVLPGGQIDRSVRNRWRFPETPNPTPITEGPAVESVESSAESSFIPEDSSEVLPVNFVEDTPDPPVYFTDPVLVQDWKPLWPSRRIPNMIGDFIGAGRELLAVRGDQLLNASPTDVLDPDSLGTGNQTDFLVVDPGSSVLGRQKPSENNSPWTRDRVYLDYSYLDKTSLQDGGVGVHRFVPGVEKTFAEGIASWQVRLPMGITFDSTSVLTGGSSRDQGELGNIYAATKVLLCSSNTTVVSAGLGANFPTADDLQFRNTNGRELVRVENRSVHLLPYLAAAWTEDDGGWFAQSFLQLDYDVNGNAVFIDNGRGLADVGNFHDAHYLYWDIGGGCWLIRDRQGSTITGVAPTLELHYNTALNTPDGVRSDSGFQFGVNRGQIEVVNLLLGVTMELASRHTLAIGYGTPLGGGDDEQYDSQLRVLLNCHFGGQ